MARFAPAACSPCAIAHAIDRLFATPKTTAVLPFRSSNIPELSSSRKDISWDTPSYDLRRRKPTTESQRHREKRITKKHLLKLVIPNKVRDPPSRRVLNINSKSR